MKGQFLICSYSELKTLNLFFSSTHIDDIQNLSLYQPPKYSKYTKYSKYSNPSLYQPPNAGGPWWLHHRSRHRWAYIVYKVCEYFVVLRIVANGCMAFIIYVNQFWTLSLFSWYYTFFFPSPKDSKSKIPVWKGIFLSPLNRIEHNLDECCSESMASLLGYMPTSLHNTTLYEIVADNDKVFLE